jgi:hypothetical protein
MLDTLNAYFLSRITVSGSVSSLLFPEKIIVFLLGESTAVRRVHSHAAPHL